MLATLGVNKLYSCAAESYHCGNSTLIISFHFSFNFQEAELYHCILSLWGIQKWAAYFIIAVKGGRIYRSLNYWPKRRKEEEKPHNYRRLNKDTMWKRCTSLWQSLNLQKKPGTVGVNYSNSRGFWEYSGFFFVWPVQLMTQVFCYESLNCSAVWRTKRNA